MILAKFQSDLIEKGFGWYCQLSGENYWISLRQIYESEKNVKSRSLIKISKVNMSDLKVVMTVESEVEVKDIMKELHKIHSLMFPVNEIEDIGDKNIIYYIA